MGPLLHFRFKARFRIIFHLDLIGWELKMRLSHRVSISDERGANGYDRVKLFELGFEH